MNVIIKIWPIWGQPKNAGLGDDSLEEAYGINLVTQSLEEAESSMCTVTIQENTIYLQYLTNFYYCAFIILVAHVKDPVIFVMKVLFLKGFFSDILCET